MNRKKIIIVSLAILIFLALGFVLYFNKIVFKADTASRQCFAGAYYYKNTVLGKYTGVSATVSLGDVQIDESRFQTVTYDGNNYCKSKDNPDVYFGIKDVGGQETDIGLAWELAKEADGSISQTQKVFRPYWRTGGQFNVAPANVNYQWVSGETVEMTLDIPRDNSIVFKVSGSGKSFTTPAFSANIRKGAQHEIKFATAIDQMGREGKSVENTNTKFTGTNWISREVVLNGSNQSVNIPNLESQSRQFCPAKVNTTLQVTDNTSGGEVVSINGNSYASVKPETGSCGIPAPATSGRDIIITTPSVIKSGQSSKIAVNFKELNGYNYHLWISGSSSNCKNPENGVCFFSKTSGAINSDDQTINYDWDTKAASTTVGNHVVRVKVFKNETSGVSFCKKEGSMSVATGAIPASPANLTTGSISCGSGKNEIAAAASPKSVTIDLGQFYDLYAPAEFAILRDGTQIATTTEKSFTDSSVEAGEYQYEAVIRPVQNQKESFLDGLFKKAYAQPQPTPSIPSGFSEKILVTVPPTGAPTPGTAVGPTARAGTISVGPSAQVSTGGPVQTDIGSVTNIGEFATLLFTWGIPVIGSLAVLMFIYAGYLYMTSQGNQENITKAKDIIFGVIIGLLLLFTVGIILKNVIGTVQ